MLIASLKGHSDVVNTLVSNGADIKLAYKVHNTCTCTCSYNNALLHVVMYTPRAHGNTGGYHD